MIQEPNQKKGRRILKTDVARPLEVDVSLLRGWVGRDKIFEETSVITRQTCYRSYMANGVCRKEITDGGRLQGTIFIPAGNAYDVNCGLKVGSRRVI